MNQAGGTRSVKHNGRNLTIQIQPGWKAGTKITCGLRPSLLPALPSLATRAPFSQLVSLLLSLTRTTAPPYYEWPLPAHLPRPLLRQWHIPRESRVTRISPDCYCAGFGTKGMSDVAKLISRRYEEYGVQFVVAEAEHERFSRDGNDLVLASVHAHRVVL